jgi:hypothetical protein
MLMASVKIPLTPGDAVKISLTGMTTNFTRSARTLLANVESLLNGPNPRDRVRGVRHIALGVGDLERRVIWNARDHGMTWEAIAQIYGTTRQAVQQRIGGH